MARARGVRNAAFRFAKVTVSTTCETADTFPTFPASINCAAVTKLDPQRSRLDATQIWG